ncbi:MAG: extracellular solute-binding protein, partial [Thermomicrobiales bacterium]
MKTKHSRRSILRGAAASVAAAGALPLVGAPSSVFAAPALVQTPGSQLEIVYWTTNASGTEAEAEETLTKAFEEANPGVRINRVLQTTYEDTAAALIAALQTGNEPHLAILSDIWWFRFYLSESLADLTPLLKDAKIDTGDYVQRLFIEYQRNGGQYAVPYGRSTPLLYFNRDALKAAGLDESIFKTWSSIAEHAPKLVGGETEVAFGYGAGTGYGSWLLQSAVWAFGGHYSDPEFNILIAQPEAVAAGEFFRTSV